MAYRLKRVRYQDSDRKILLQNENGPCPLLAAANALLLKGVISLPAECIRNGAASIDEVVNLLAERALKRETEHHHLNELLQIFPKLQYGMDVNPKFTAGPTGVEYTSNLTAFDMMNVNLVHGWLLDPQDSETHQLLDGKSYNELIELVIKGREAAAEVECISKAITEREQQLKALAEGDEKKQEEGDVVEQEKGTEEEGTEEFENTTADETEKEPESDEFSSSWVDLSADRIEGTCSTAEGAESEAVAAGSTDETKEEDVNENESTEAIEKENPIKTESEQDEPDVEEKDIHESSAGGRIDGSKDTPEAKETGGTKGGTLDPKSIESELEELRKKLHELSVLATEGSLINGFLSQSSHQLTHYGLHELYDFMTEESLCVFFRNNHFATLTKHGGVLYLLVTDLGYANVPEVMWEKLDGIDGDTEYVNCKFVKPAAHAELAPSAGPNLNPEQMLAQRSQSEADYQLAIQLSKHGGDAMPTAHLDEQEGNLVAAATEASLREFNGIPGAADKAKEIPHVGVPLVSVANENAALEDQDRVIAMQLQAQMEREDASARLARELQQQENRRAANSRSSNTARQNRKSNEDKSNCVIS